MQRTLLPLLQPFPWYAQMNQTTAMLEPELSAWRPRARFPAASNGRSSSGTWATTSSPSARRPIAAAHARTRLASYLQQLDYATLDAEQQFRVHASSTRSKARRPPTRPTRSRPSWWATPGLARPVGSASEAPAAPRPSSLPPCWASRWPSTPPPIRPRRRTAGAIAGEARAGQDRIKPAAKS